MNARLVSVLLLSLLLTGCRSAESRLAGQWDEQSKSNNLLSSMAFKGGPNAKLVLTGDHKFTLETISIRLNPSNPRSTVNQGHKVEGSWSIEDKVLTFKTATVDGKAVAEYVADEQKGIEAELGKLDGVFAPSDNSNLTPEQQAAVQEAEKGLQADMSKWAKQMSTPIPTGGSVSDSFFTVTVDCENGRSMEFGKRQVDN